MLEGYSARAGQLVLLEQQQQQQPRQLSNKPVVLVGGKVGGGQKEAEQPMNPNEVIIGGGEGAGGPRMLEPLAAEVAELEDLEASAAYDDFEKRAKWNSMQGKGERESAIFGAKLKLMISHFFDYRRLGKTSAQQLEQTVCRLG